MNMPNLEMNIRQERRSAIIDMADIKGSWYISKYESYVLPGNVIKGWVILTAIAGSTNSEEAIEPVFVFETVQGKVLMVPVEHVTFVKEESQ